MRPNLLALFVLLIPLGLLADPAAPPAPAAKPPTITWKDAALPDKSVVRYALITPDGAELDPSKPHPTLLALPPGGQDEPMVTAGLHSYWTEEAARRGWVVISPVAPSGKQFYTPAGARLIEGLLDSLAKQMRFAGGRVHLAGVSNGGRSAFHLAVNAPERYHSILTLPGGAGGGDEAKLAEICTMPVYMLVGADDANWVRMARDTRERLERLVRNGPNGAPQGGDPLVTLEELAGQGHVIQIAPSRLFDILDSTHARVMSDTAESTPHFAVVELFTSEGCSSCPPADDVLAKLAQRRDADAESTASDGRVLLLSFHVDYWDRLGWPDRFAGREFSERQRQYGQVFKTSSVYTPQLIVNGTSEFVGSDSAQADREIAAALKLKSDSRLSVRVLPSGDTGPLVLEVLTPDAQPGELIHAAIVEDGLSTEVKKGENANRTLKHERVVRAFESAQAKAARATTLRLNIPTDVNRDRATIVVYTQQRKTMAITAAATRPFVRPKSAALTR